MIQPRRVCDLDECHRRIIGHSALDLQDDDLVYCVGKRVYAATYARATSSLRRVVEFYTPDICGYESRLIRAGDDKEYNDILASIDDFVSGKFALDVDGDLS